MRIHDVSLPLRRDMVFYPGDPRLEIRPFLTIEKDGVRVDTLCFGSHTGTHVDAPAHLLAGGRTVESLPLELLTGKCVLCQPGDGPEITADLLESAGIPSDAVRVLFKTRNSARERSGTFREDAAALTAGAAEWLVGRGVRLVGINGLSVDRYTAEEMPAHRVLLEAGIVIVEGLDFSGVVPGTYTLVCLPLRIEGGDGSPARVVLIYESD